MSWPGVGEVGWGATERKVHEICSLIQKMRGKDPAPWRQGKNSGLNSNCWGCSRKGMESIKREDDGEEWS